MKTKKTRKPMTAEQQAKYEAKKSRMKELTELWGKMSQTERDSLVAKIGAIPTTEGRALSPRNTMLCYYQREGVSMVGGFKQWLTQGRCVKKGETGISILFPSKFVKEGEVPDENSKEYMRFFAGTVFDISQTQPVEDRENLARIAGR